MKTKRKWPFVVLATAALACCAFNQRLTCRFYEVESKKLSAGTTIRLVLVSDLHGYEFGAGQKKLLQLIAEQNPDLILCPGDMADDEVPIDGTLAFFEGTAQIAPTCYTTGNHEWWSGEEAEMERKISAAGAVVLRNENRTFAVGDATVRVGGIDDPAGEGSSKYGSLPEKWVQSACDGMGADSLNILLAHRPELYRDYEGHGLDLAVSGHAHGGQVRIPLLLNGLLAPNQGIFPKRAGGIYTDMSFTHIVCRGTGINPLLPRVFNPPEVCVITVKGAV